MLSSNELDAILQQHDKRTNKRVPDGQHKNDVYYTGFGEHVGGWTRYNSITSSIVGGYEGRAGKKRQYIAKPAAVYTASKCVK